MFAVANKAINQPNDDLAVILAIIIGMGLLFWVVWYFTIRAKGPYEIFYYGKSYTTKNATRIIGMYGESVVDGQLTAWLQSLWRDNGNGKFLILYLLEVGYPNYRPVERDVAKKFIIDNSNPEHARKLIKDFFNEYYVP